MTIIIRVRRIHAELGEVVTEEEGERASHAVSGEGDAHLLIPVLANKAGDLGKDMVAGLRQLPVVNLQKAALEL